jgi:UDP-N-acetylglucosamine 4,6-dehydratase
MNKKAIEEFNGKTLLITGGTGSFGNQVLKRFMDTDIKQIKIFSRDEKKQDEMRRRISSDKVQFIIGDVRDIASIRDAVKGVDYVFHAAALKQVPSCEFFPLEAVKTNILGTDNVLSACIFEGVRKVICLSTDKAAYPVNAMGISKAMMEKVTVAKARNLVQSSTVICTTRYGNVLNSRGSVIPLFIEQLRNGNSLTLTHPMMTRFLMSLEEAMDLVLYAFLHGNNGDIFVQKSPSCYIGDLARAVKLIFNATTNVKIIGIRHGEKMYEVLMTREEAGRANDLGDYYQIPCDARDLNYEKFLREGSFEISEAKEYSSNSTTILSVEEIIQKILTLDELKIDFR